MTVISSPKAQHGQQRTISKPGLDTIAPSLNQSIAENLELLCRRCEFMKNKARAAHMRLQYSGVMRSDANDKHVQPIYWLPKSHIDSRQDVVTH